MVTHRRVLPTRRKLPKKIFQQAKFRERATAYPSLDATKLLMVRYCDKISYLVSYHEKNTFAVM